MGPERDSLPCPRARIGDRGARLAGAGSSGRLGGVRLKRIPRRGWAAACRPPRRARRVAAVDRRCRRAREDDDRGDDRVRAPRDGRGPELDRGRRGAAARRERGLRAGLARRRRRRVGPLRRSSSSARRRGHQRRPRPPRDLRLPGRGRAPVRGVAGGGSAGRTRMGDGSSTRSTSSWPSPASTTDTTLRRRSRPWSWPAFRATARPARSRGSRVSAGASSESARREV